MTEEEKLAEEHKVKFLEVYKLTTPGLLTESEIDNYNRGLGIGYEYGFKEGFKAGKNMNVSAKFHNYPEKHKIKREGTMDKFYNICKFILFLCSTIIILLHTIALIYVAIR